MPKRQGRRTPRGPDAAGELRGRLGEDRYRRDEQRRVMRQRGLPGCGERVALRENAGARVHQPHA